MLWINRIDIVSHLIEMPRQTDSQAIGYEGERWFAAQLPPLWIPQRPQWDVGVDFHVVICEDGPANGLEFRVQVKSAHRLSRREDSIVVKGFRKSALLDLLQGYVPALLVLYECSSERGFCFWLNQLVAQRPELIRTNAKTITLTVFKKNPGLESPGYL